MMFASNKRSILQIRIQKGSYKRGSYKLVAEFSSADNDGEALRQIINYFEFGPMSSWGYRPQETFNYPSGKLRVEKNKISYTGTAIELHRFLKTLLTDAHNYIANPEVIATIADTFPEVASNPSLYCIPLAKQRLLEDYAGDLLQACEVEIKHLTNLKPQYSSDESKHKVITYWLLQFSNLRCSLKLSQLQQVVKGSDIESSTSQQSSSLNPKM